MMLRCAIAILSKKKNKTFFFGRTVLYAGS